MKIKKIKAPKSEESDAAPKQPAAEYVFLFEMLHPYPSIRSFIVKKPLKRSFMDGMTDIFGSGMKGS